MKKICINSNGLVIYCSFLKSNPNGIDIVSLLDENLKPMGSLYIDESHLKYFRQDDHCKYYKVITKNNK